MSNVVRLADYRRHHENKSTFEPWSLLLIAGIIIGIAPWVALGWMLL